MNCRTCSRPFESNIPWKVFCSKDCDPRIIVKHKKEKGGSKRDIQEKVDIKNALNLLAKRNYLGLRFEILKRDNFKCVYCGRTPETTELQVDHVIPKSKGGGNNVENLVTSCRFCNLGKSDVLLNKS